MHHETQSVKLIIRNGIIVTLMMIIMVMFIIVTVTMVKLIMRQVVQTIIQKVHIVRASDVEDESNEFAMLSA